MSFIFCERSPVCATTRDFSTSASHRHSHQETCAAGPELLADHTVGDPGERLDDLPYSCHGKCASCTSTCNLVPTGALVQAALQTRHSTSVSLGITQPNYANVNELRQDTLSMVPQTSIVHRGKVLLGAQHRPLLLDIESDVARCQVVHLVDCGEEHGEFAVTSKKSRGMVACGSGEEREACPSSVVPARWARWSSIPSLPISATTDQLRVSAWVLMSCKRCNAKILPLDVSAVLFETVSAAVLQWVQRTPQPICLCIRCSV